MQDKPDKYHEEVAICTSILVPLMSKQDYLQQNLQPKLFSWNSMLRYFFIYLTINSYTTNSHKEQLEIDIKVAFCNQ